MSEEKPLEVAKRLYRIAKDNLDAHGNRDHGKPLSVERAQWCARERTLKAELATAFEDYRRASIVVPPADPK